MPRRGTVLVVDDSSLLRRIVAETLDGVPGLTVVGQAANGRDALAKMSELDPDLVSLDIEMPGMNGLEVITRVMSTRPRKIVVVSSHTDAGADVTLQALSSGAVDFVAKGKLDGGPDGFESQLRRTFLGALDARIAGSTAAAPARRRPARTERPSSPGARSDRNRPRPASRQADRSASGPRQRPGREPRRSVATPRRAPARLGPEDRPSSPPTRSGGSVAIAKPDLIVVASSTGGPPALQTLLSTIRRPPVAPMVIVQHMPANFTNRLAQRLDGVGPATVKESEDGDVLRAGTIQVAAGGHHVAVERGRLRHDDRPPIGALKPRADITLDTAAKVYGRRVLAIVMTGMGDDGLEGCRAVHRAGGQIVAQDAASCTVDGMPRQVRSDGITIDEGPPAYLGALLDRLGER